MTEKIYRRRMKELERAMMPVSLGGPKMSMKLVSRIRKLAERCQHFERIKYQQPCRVKTADEKLNRTNHEDFPT